MGVFDRRVSFKPYEYPWAVEFKEKMQDSYWTHREMKFDSDVDDFKVRLTPVERQAVKRAMLAISQVEVAVKEFWSKLGDRFPKAEFKQVGITFGESECYDDQTEVLSESGWMRFADVPDDAKVAQYDPVSGVITFAHPTARVSRHYSGEMHHYISTGTDLMVTPGHEILVKHPAKEFYEKRRSDAGRWGRNYRYPVAGRATCGDPLPFTDMDRVLIAVQADGCLYGCTPSGSGRRDVVFNLQKPRKIERLKALLSQLGIGHTESVRANNGHTAINFRLPDEWPVEPEQIKSFGYIDLTRVSEDYGREFVRELAEWDGTPVAKHITYYNANGEAVDKVQAIAAMSGFSTNKGVNRTAEEMMAMPLPGGGERKNAKTVYALCIQESDMRVYPYAERVQYDGIVYCLTVPAGCLVTRRGKRVTISGNCRHADAYSELLTVLGLNEDFDALLQVPAIKGRVDYLTKHLSSGDGPQRHTLSLALFSLFVENVSLFAQFAVIKSVFKHRALLKNIDNVVQATQLEEQLHALFGVRLVNTIREENPDWFDTEFYDRVYAACDKAYEAESAIVDWIYESGDLPYLTADTLKAFLRDRFDQSLAMIGGKPLFFVPAAKLAGMRWFDEELLARINPDFFNKRPVTYSRFGEPITADDLF